MGFKEKLKKSIVLLSATCLVFSGNVIPTFAEAAEGTDSSAFVDLYGYDVKVKVIVDENGKITEVWDAGTTPGKNEFFWKTFVDGGGFENFKGKSKDDIDKVDAVTNATYTSKGVKDAVKKALENVEGAKPESENPKIDEIPAVTPGIKNGEAPVFGTDDSSKKFKVTVTVGSDGRIESIKDNGSSLPYKYKKYNKEFWGKYKGANYYIGKSLEDVLAMDVDNGFGAHVPGSKDEQSLYAVPAKGVKQAVLNALGYSSVAKTENDKIVSGTSNVSRYNYEQRVKVRIAPDGRITEVTDNGTKEQSNYKTTDNLKRIERFEKGCGYEKYKGKTISDVKAMDIGKHGVDGVSGATYNSHAVRNSVLNAFENAGYDTSKPAKQVKGRVFYGESEKPFDRDGNKIKIKAYIDDNFRIVRIEDNGSVPGEVPWEGLQHGDSPWDKFAKYRGFAKFHGKNIEDVNRMDMNTVDSIDVAGKQVNISLLARDAVLLALTRALENPPADKTQLNLDIAEAKKLLSEIVEGEKPGEYKPETKSILAKAIEVAEAVVDDDYARQETVTSAQHNLMETLKTVKASVITKQENKDTTENNGNDNSPESQVQDDSSKENVMTDTESSKGKPQAPTVNKVSAEKNAPATGDENSIVMLALVLSAATAIFARIKMKRKL